ncbi:MAG TPA: ATP-binding protein [Stellaceae bacterium]|jgi:two-component system phosphate regulon sensor histidine kinase PhoR|nr:ATP-binding protein [Stellaceae bacterium]
MALSGPPVHVPLPRLIRAAFAFIGPLAVAFLALAGYAALDPGAAAAAFVALSVLIVFIVQRHLTGLEAVRRTIDNLARDEPASPVDRPEHALGLAEAVAALDRRWTRHGGALRAASAANEAILEAIPEPLILVDQARRVVRANAAARVLFGDSVAGRDLDAVLRYPDVLEAAEEYLAGAPSVAMVDIAWPGPPERHFAVRLARLPNAEKDRDEPAILLVLHDVTALKRAERMRADFVANVSHELRTPLSALLGFTETLQGAARDDASARERFLGIMHEQAQRMTRLVRDLLSLSRIEELEHTPLTERVDVARVLGSVIDTLALQAKAKNTAIEVDTAPDIGPVLGDGDQLAQVFQNLIDNAIKYGRAGGAVRIVGRVTATAPTRIVAAGRNRGTPPARWVSVAIADDGEGIPAEHLPRLTERFYRVDAARSRQLGGTGLGLAIVKHILNRHRGGVAISSESGRGSVFTVWLPAAGASKP